MADIQQSTAAEAGQPASIGAIIFQTDVDVSHRQLRPLYQIYDELGQTLMATAASLKRKGQTEQANYRYSEAVQAFQQATYEQPDNPMLRVYMAQAREGQGRAGDAIVAYLDAVRSAPQLAASVLPRVHNILTVDLARSAISTAHGCHWSRYPRWTATPVRRSTTF